MNLVLRIVMAVDSIPLLTKTIIQGRSSCADPKKELNPDTFLFPQRTKLLNATAGKRIMPALLKSLLSIIFAVIVEVEPRALS